MAREFFSRFLLPGLLLQSVMIGGGYSTGRELVEFFLSLGPISSFLALAIACFGISIVAAATFEFARMVNGFDYKTFFEALIGRAWPIYEIAYFILGALVLAVISSAAGEVVALHFGLSSLIGVLLLTGLICALVVFGTSAIERVLSFWSIALYSVFLVFIILFFWRSPGDTVMIESPPLDMAEAAKNGLVYLGYNVASLPVILFCVSRMKSRKEAIISGLFAGPLAAIPAGVFLIMMSYQYPDILSSPLPADDLLADIGMPWFTLLFYVIVFGTLVETGAAYIHAVNQRLATEFKNRRREMPSFVRLGFAVTALSVSIILAETVGLIDLIASGYGTLTWVFLLVYVLPLLTLGFWRMRNNKTSTD